MIGELEVCPECGNVTVVPAMDIAPVPPQVVTPPQQTLAPQKVQVQPAHPKVPVCQHCGSPMQKKILSSGGCLGMILLLGGIIACFIPGVGCFLGPLTIIGGLLVGGTKKKVWRCVQCGIIADCT